MMKNLLLLFVSICCLHFAAGAQDDDLLGLLGAEESVDLATASFKTNRVVNGHSIENTARGVLDFKISHRFGPLRGGPYDLFGLDAATTNFAFDYGITDRLMTGIGRTTREKTINGFIKYKILRQQTGKRNLPLTLSYLADAQVKTIKVSTTDPDYKFAHRWNFSHQLLIGRKFSDAFSLQLMPTVVHRNLAPGSDPNDVFIIGAAGRVKIAKRIAVNVEYYYVLPNQMTTTYTNSLSLGFDVETGGHVFQLHFTNSQDMSYKGFLTETNEDWFYKNTDGDLISGLRFGFNISRVFTIVKPKALY